MKKRILIAIACIFALCFVMKAKADCTYSSDYYNAAGSHRVVLFCSGSKVGDYYVEEYYWQYMLGF